MWKSMDRFVSCGLRDLVDTFLLGTGSNLLDLLRGAVYELRSEHLLGIGTEIVGTCVGLGQTVSRAEAGTATAGEVSKSEALLTGGTPVRLLGRSGSSLTTQRRGRDCLDRQFRTCHEGRAGCGTGFHRVGIGWGNLLRRVKFAGEHS